MSLIKYWFLKKFQCQGSLCAVGMSTLQWALLSGPWVTGVVLQNPLWHPTCPDFFSRKEKWEGAAGAGSAAGTWAWDSHGPQSRHICSPADQPWECGVHEMLASWLFLELQKHHKELNRNSSMHDCIGCYLICKTWSIFLNRCVPWSL